MVCLTVALDCSDNRLQREEEAGSERENSEPVEAETEGTTADLPLEEEPRPPNCESQTSMTTTPPSTSSSPFSPPYQPYIPSSPALSTRRYTSLPKLKSAAELMVESKGSRIFGTGSCSSASPSPEVPVSTASQRQTPASATPAVKMPRTYEPGTVKKLLRTFSSELEGEDNPSFPFEYTQASSHAPLTRAVTSPKRPEPRGMEKRYQQALEEAQRLSETQADANGNIGGPSIEGVDGKELSIEEMVEQWLMRKSSTKDKSGEDECCQCAKTPVAEHEPTCNAAPRVHDVPPEDHFIPTTASCKKTTLNISSFASDRSSSKLVNVYSDNKQKMVNHTKRLFKVNN
jgi:hypothetical protein